MALSSTQTLDDESRRRLTIGFNNFAHAVDHYVMLIFPTVVIGLEAVYGRPYGELLALGTASFFAFGMFSLPAGWLADHWSRRNMMAVFYFGCGCQLRRGGVRAEFHRARHRAVRARRVRRDLSSGRHRDRGRGATNRGRTLAFNGVCGNIGVSLAAGITAALTAWIGWRGAFLVPAVVCVATGIAYFVMVPDDRKQAAGRSAAPDVRLAMGCMVAVFALFILIGTTAGLVFNAHHHRAAEGDRRAHRQRHFAGCGRRHCHRGVPVRRGRAVRGRAHGGEISGASGVRVHRADAVHRRGLGGLCHRLRAARGAGLRHGLRLRAGDGQRFRHRALHRRRMARPRLCGALLHHLS